MIINIKEFQVIGGGISDDTKEIQRAIEFCAKNGYILAFDNRTYLCNTLYIPKNANIDFKGATIKCISYHLLYNFREDDKYTKYNGNGNITIKNLNIIGGHVASFIHGENILFENIFATKADNDHYFEICACKNVTIKNSTFIGIKKQKEGRQMVEMIQIDMCTRNAFPWFLDKESVTYDGTTNQNILIDNCLFDKGEDEYQQIYTAIGVHGKDCKFHQNIIIKNCIIKNALYAAIHGISWNNTQIISNTFINCKDNIFENCTNLIIENNKFDK